MAPRSYRMESRATAARLTKQRIVEATMALHFERGVLATSHKDVAARADVSVGTVYHYFPTQEAIVQACGAEVRLQFPPPDAGAIDTRAAFGKRVEQLAAILVDMYAAMPWVERLRTERDRVAALDAGITARERAVEILIRRALGRHARRKFAVAVVAAVLDAAPIHRLLSAGLSRDDVVRTLASLIHSWFEGEHA
jgi:AcrR family transcriptional regulator